MINCKIVTPMGLYAEIETEIINCVAIDGQVGILPNHMPIVLMLDISKLTTIEEGKRMHYAIGGGMLYFSDNVATILVDSVESQNEIDPVRAEAAKERAEKRIESKDDNIDFRRAEIALKKAINRLKVKDTSN